MSDLTRSLMEQRRWDQVLPAVGTKAQIVKELSSTPVKTAKQKALRYLERGYPSPSPVKPKAGRKTRKRKTRRRY